MAACAAGELCVATVAQAALPEYAPYFSLKRYDDQALMESLHEAN